MKSQRRDQLLQKGWRQEELIRAEAILEKATRHDVFFSKIVFWSALVVIVFANIIVSAILIPFLIALYGPVLFAIVAVLGLMIGFLYNFLITDIGLLETRHHRTASIIVPIIGMGNIIVMVLTSNHFIKSIQLNNQPHSPWIIAAIFGGAFILPYLVDQIFGLSK